MLRDVDRAYIVLMDELQDAYDTEFRLRASGEAEHRASREFTAAQERVQRLIERIAIMLHPNQACEGLRR